MTGKAKRLIAACVQLNAGPEIMPNLEAAAVLVRQARAAGAELIALPENADLKVQSRETLWQRTAPEDAHPAVPFFADLARETGAWLLGGSIAVKRPEDRDAPSGKLYNRSLLFDPQGRIAGRYDKIHLFDVDLPNGETYRESDKIMPGHEAVVAATPWGGLGMSICYDVRFPHLYRALAQGGADILAAPSAFTVPTGKAHWHVLMRARAIETGCFLLAPAQCGTHDGGRQTAGHSLIINPWGEVLAEASEEPGFITAELDLTCIAETRANIPAWHDNQAFSLL